MKVTRREWLASAALLAACRPSLAALSDEAAKARLQGGPGASPDFRVIPTKIYPSPDAPDGVWPVKYRKLIPPTAPRARYPGFRPGQFVLKAGSVRRPGALPLPVDILFERDVALKLRDGVTLYTDIYRPIGGNRTPAIFSWSPYGKELGGQWLDDLPGRSGVPLERVSELQRFEGADPAYWCAHGYAVVNPDPRGAYKSEGNVNYWGRQLAEDGYDVVEWIAAQPWCAGPVVMSGNSWLAVSQWFVAAERPPHLAAIAPWEGLMDQGPAPGMPVGVTFGEIIIQSLAGDGYIEDQPRMTIENPLMNGFWADRRARVERIEVPAYIVASYTNVAHTVGTFEAWRLIGSAQKWLRIHNTQEWADYYEPTHVEDLRRFFDHYAKGVDNGWETTPTVRMAVLDPGHTDILNREETSFPPARARTQRLFLDAADAGLKPKLPGTEEKVSYIADGGHTTFRFRFASDAELCGYIVVKLFVEAQGSDDMELFVSLRRVPGIWTRLIERLTPGPPQNTASGFLRVSMRELDPERSTELHPVLAMRREMRLKPGEITSVEIALSPMAMRYRTDDELELSIGAFQMPEFIPLRFGEAQVPFPKDGLTFPPNQSSPMLDFGGKPEAAATARAVKPPPSRNRGTHILHTGGSYAAHLVAQIIDPSTPN